MSSEIKTSSLDFGTVIAFVAPGFIGLYALSYHVSTAKTWLDAASNKEQSVGVFLMVLLASIAIGLVISGVRQLVIDSLLCSSRLGRFALPKHSLDWSKITDKNLRLLNAIRDGYYWYYQFLFEHACCRCFLGRSASDGRNLFSMVAMGGHRVCVYWVINLSPILASAL